MVPKKFNVFLNALKSLLISFDFLIFIIVKTAVTKPITAVNNLIILSFILFFLPHLLHNTVNLQLDNFRVFKTVIVNDFDGYAVRSCL